MIRPHSLFHVFCVSQNGDHFAVKYRVTPKKRELLKNQTKIEEIQEKKFIDRN